MRALAALVVAALIALGARELYGRYEAGELRKQLYSAEFDKVPAVVDEMGQYRRWADPLLVQDNKEAIDTGNEEKHLRTSIALLPTDGSQVAYLYERLISAGPGEIDAIGVAMQPAKEQIVEKLWGVVRSPDNDQRLLCVSAALARYSPADPRWKDISQQVAAVLSRTNPFFVKDWAEKLSPIRGHLLVPLAGIARNSALASERLTATSILKGAAEAPAESAAADWAGLLVPVLLDGDKDQFDIVFPLLAGLGPQPARLLAAEIEPPIAADPAAMQHRDRSPLREARAAIALMRLGHAEKVWPAFMTSKDDSLRSYLVHWCPRYGVDSQLVLRRWPEETDPGARAGLLLLLGEFGESGLSSEQRRPFAGQVAAVFETDADAGLHAAAGWLLRQWKCGKIVDAAVKRLAKKEPQRRANDEYRKRRWYVNSEGQTYVVVDAQQPFQMGSPASEHGPDVTGETQHLETVGRRFAIAATPVTVEQFRGYLANNPDEAATTRSESPGSADAPKTDVMWFQAVKYCNWLSAKDEIPKDQWCYEPNKDDKFADGMTVKEDYVKLTGYRLPTEAEWEFACRAGTTTPYYFGGDEALLPEYARYRVNSERHVWPVAGLKPNDLGLFDMHGNVWQWCEWPQAQYPKSSDVVQDDRGKGGKVNWNIPAALRGGAYNNQLEYLRDAFRYRLFPNYHEPQVGFRPARTIVLPKE